MPPNAHIAAKHVESQMGRITQLIYCIGGPQQFYSLRSMKTKRLVANQQLHPHIPHKNNPSRLASKRKLNEVRSQDAKYRPRALNPQPQPQVLPHKLMKPQPFNPALDYDFQRRERQTMNYAPFAQPIPSQGEPGNFRSQRNSHNRQFLQQRENNFLNHSNTRSHQSSSHRIKIFSTDKNENSVNHSQRSDHSASKRRTGIELTKTLLKRISGMYNDKDFQNKSSYIKSSREETTGFTNNMSGRVQDEYQLSDFDLQVHNNQTFNASYNSHQLSFNQSGSWHRTDRAPEPEHLLRESGHSKDSHAGRWRDSHDSGYWNQPNDSKNHIRTATQVRESGYHPKPQIYEQRNNFKARNQHFEGVLQAKEKPRISFNTPSKRQLPKVKSYEVLGNNRPISQSIEIGGQPPAQEGPRRRHPQASPEPQRYVIQSKNKTLQQLSVKQSMVLGFDNYYI